MEPEGSLPHSQGPSFFPIPNQTTPVHTTASYPSKSLPNIIHLPRIDPRILVLGTSLRWAVYFTSRPLYLRQKNLVEPQNWSARDLNTDPARSPSVGIPIAVSRLIACERVTLTRFLENVRIVSMCNINKILLAKATDFHAAGKGNSVYKTKLYV
jgi:hypothetical protein